MAVFGIKNIQSVVETCAPPQFLLNQLAWIDDVFTNAWERSYVTFSMMTSLRKRKGPSYIVVVPILLYYSAQKFQKVYPKSSTYFSLISLYYPKENDRNLTTIPFWRYCTVSPFFDKSK